MKIASRGQGGAGLTPCPGVRAVPLTAVGMPISGRRITVDQTAIGNWNEIDAVKLVGIP